MRRRRDGAEVQCSVSQAAATSFPASSTAPMMMMGQKAPAKIAVRPSMEKAADTQASARATTKAASLTLTATRRSGWERSQVSASRSSRGIHSNTGRQSGSSCSI
jgi:hypothetical protein